uniref:Uncharacterized protein n=1 Tax=Micrurus surinamensis TaxID=129470 RepID=A0A2D4NSG2_MICSU
MDEEVYNMYCFVIQDKSPFIESKLKVLHNITTHLTHITESNAFGHIWHYLTSWLPDFGWLKILFIGICVAIIIGIVSCICVKSLTLCELCTRCCTGKKAVQSGKTVRKQEIMMMLNELDSQM